MKILIYCWSLANGGAEHVAALWAEGFAKKYDVCVMLCTFRTREDYHLPSGIKVRRQSKVFDLWKKIIPQCVGKYFFSSRYCDLAYNILPNFIKNWFTSKVIKEESPDVIITVLPILFDRIRGALKMCNLKVPVIVTDHNAYERPCSAPLSKELEWLKFANSVNYDYLTVLTEADKRVLEQKMNSEFMKKVFVLPNPLTYNPANRIPQKKNIILAAGRIDAWFFKGFDLLLKAWAMIQSDFPNWTLRIAGGGDKTPLEKICDELKISNRVELLGFVDLKKQYESASIFVLSSRCEGFGMVLTEAMSQGCACIACDYKGRQREIIANDMQGIVCPTDDEVSIANAIRRLIKDESYRCELQKNAIERSKFYELPNIMNRWNEIFESVGVK